MAGEALRNLRLPQVARDRANGKALITLNGAEDRFYVLQMDDETASDLTDKLLAAGYAGTPR
jgi:hypothetical protein